jgi:hypothetical protein
MAVASLIAKSAAVVVTALIVGTALSLSIWGDEEGYLLYPNLAVALEKMI